MSRKSASQRRTSSVLRARRCRHFRDRLTAAADARVVTDLALRRHVKGCVSCREELAQHRAIGRALRGMDLNAVRPAPAGKGRDTRNARRLSPLAASGVGAVGVLAVLALGSARRRS